MQYTIHMAVELERCVKRQQLILLCVWVRFSIFDILYIHGTAHFIILARIHTGVQDSHFDFHQKKENEQESGTRRTE